MDVINKEDMKAEREEVVEALDLMIDELTTCLRASEIIKKQFDASDASFNFEELRDAIRDLSDYVEGHWHRLSLGKTSGVWQIENYIANVETPYVEEEEVKYTNKPFQFDSNACFGYIDSQERLDWLVSELSKQTDVNSSIGDVSQFILNAKIALSTLEGMTASFGYRIEHQGELTLGEWLSQP